MKISSKIHAFFLERRLSFRPAGKSPGKPSDKIAGAGRERQAGRRSAARAGLDGRSEKKPPAPEPRRQPGSSQKIILS
jgi:hypothetical protein